MPPPPHIQCHPPHTSNATPPTHAFHPNTLHHYHSATVVRKSMQCRPVPVRAPPARLPTILPHLHNCRPVRAAAATAPTRRTLPHPPTRHLLTRRPIRAAAAAAPNPASSTTQTRKRSWSARAQSSAAPSARRRASARCTAYGRLARRAGGPHRPDVPCPEPGPFYAFTHARPGAARRAVS
eukprot:361044-Chlamydomonas_euryale.AAC.6